MIVVGVTTGVQVGTPTESGGPVWPIFSVNADGPKVPVADVLTMEIGVQLTGTAFPRNTMTGWVGSSLHSSVDASWLALNPAPDTFTTSPPARPLHTDPLHVPAAEVLIARVIVGVAADADMAVPSSTPPDIRATIPTNPSLEASFVRRASTFPPSPCGSRGGAESPSPIQSSPASPTGGLRATMGRRATDNRDNTTQ